MRHYEYHRNKKSFIKARRIKNIAATLRNIQTAESDQKMKTPVGQFSNTEGPIFSDVLGSYTGMTYDDESPVQDADDL